jgi:hypothetical protein
MEVPFIRDNEININEEEWQYLNQTFNRFELIKKISEKMALVPLPYAKITYEEAIIDFQELCKLDSSTLIKEGRFVSKFDYKYSYQDTYIDISRIGNKSSNFFHQEARFRCGSKNAPSPYRTWNDGKLRRSVLKHLWSMKTTNVDSTRLRQALQLRNYVAAQFRPSAAKAFYEHFNSKVVLDFSAGWGDRLSGFCASKDTRSYIGLDPNEALHGGYSHQIAAYAGTKGVVMKPICAEDVDYTESNSLVDTVFTSPPYFNAELYSAEPTQSYLRYSKLEEWLDKFLFTTIKNCWKTLRVGGVLGINISDIVTNKVRYNICDPMNDFISKLDGAEYLGALGYRMPQRINSVSKKGEIFAEPIWIWRKNVKSI